MKSLKKRIFSGAMAGVLALSLAVPAFAGAADANTTVVDGTLQVADIAVTVPETGKAFINPYGLDIEVPENAADDTNTNKTTISGQQIVSAPMAITNESKMDLTIGASVTGVVKTGSTMTFATATTKGTPDLPENDINYVAPATSKTAFVYLQAKASTAADTDLIGAEANVTAAKIATAYAAWEAEDYDSATDVIVSTRAATTEDLVTLRAATVDNAGAVTYNAGSIGLFRLTGDCPASPRTAWTDTDGFTATIAFTFKVANIAKYDVTLSVDGTNAKVKDTTVSATKAVAGDDVVITVPVTGLGTGDKVHFTVTTVEDTPRKLNGTVVDDGTNDVTGTFEMPNVPVTVTVTVDTNGTSGFVTT